MCACESQSYTHSHLPSVQIEFPFCTHCLHTNIKTSEHSHGPLFCETNISELSTLIKHKRSLMGALLQRQATDSFLQTFADRFRKDKKVKASLKTAIKVSDGLLL